MKKMLYILAAVVAIVALNSCSKDDSNGRLDANAKVSIRPNTQLAAMNKAQSLDPVEVVRLTTDIVLVSPKYPNEPWINFGISNAQKDLATPKIMMWVIENGKISCDFVGAKDVILVTRQNQDGSKPISDTLAYIPNATLRRAEITIRTAYADKDYDRVYQLFDEAYRFTPITGEEWRTLKAQGLN